MDHGAAQAAPVPGERTPEGATTAPPASWPADWFEENHTCLFCHGSALDPLLEGVRDWFFGAVPGDFAIDRCRDCGSLVLPRRPDAAHLGLAYQGYYTHRAGSEAPPARSLVQRIGRMLATGYARHRYHFSRAPGDALCAAAFARFPVRRAEVDAEHRYLPDRPARVLDFGCGNGQFLARARDLGHDVLGVDFDPAAVEVAAAQGIRVLLPDQLAGEPLDGGFDLVTAAHVIEHVPDPLALLRQFRGWLKPGGALFIEVPNAAAEGLARYGRFWRGLEAPRHFALPTAAALTAALEQSGFAVEVAGRRAFAAGFMWTVSQEAREGQADRSTGLLAGPAAGGPEILAFLARAR